MKVTVVHDGGDSLTFRTDRNVWFVPAGVVVDVEAAGPFSPQLTPHRRAC